MKIGAAIAQIELLYVETAPLIYYVEENAAYLDRMEIFIGYIEKTENKAISSVISLTEVLTHPLRLGHNRLAEEYRTILLYSGNFRLLPVTAAIADSAAHLRARYNLRTPDALHIATALEAGCDSFLTNDQNFKRVSELRVLILDELEIDPPTEL